MAGLMGMELLSSGLELIHAEVDHRRGAEHQDLAEDEAVDDGDTSGFARFRANLVSQG